MSSLSGLWLPSLFWALEVLRGIWTDCQNSVQRPELHMKWLQSFSSLPSTCFILMDLLTPPARSTFTFLSIFWEPPACQPHLCAWEDQGAHPPRSSAKARGEYGGDSGQPAWFLQGQGLPDQPNGLQWWSGSKSGWGLQMSSICTALWPFIQSPFNLVLLSKDKER